MLASRGLGKGAEVMPRASNIAQADIARTLRAFINLGRTQEPKP